MAKRTPPPPRKRAAKKRTKRPPKEPPKKPLRITRPVDESDRAAYESKRDRAGSTERRRSQTARDIAEGWNDEAPSAEERALWEACRLDLRLFLESFFPDAFPLRWSDDHLRFIAELQEVILDGGQLAIAMPRGRGKTSIIERAAMWAKLYGHRRFVVIVGSDEDSAVKILTSIKSELQDNERLRRPFRYVCYPIRKLEGETRRANGQTVNGKRTEIVWKDKRLTLPTLAPELFIDVPNTSGGVVSVCGLTGNLRGQKHTTTTGEILRPDLCLVDDPQTRESAFSALQTATRLAIMRGDLMGLGGPLRKVATICACTVVAPEDLADQLLDRDRNPQWRGIRVPAVYAWPTNEALWAEYLDLRAEGLRTGKGTAAATAFYRKHRAKMDAGAKVAWAQWHPDAETAVQWAIDTRADMGEEAFNAEYQNQPPKLDTGALELMTPAAIAARVNGLPRMIVPGRGEHLTAGIDVGDSLLFWSVYAWSADFTGWCVAYGVWPEQPRRLMRTRKAARTLAHEAPNAGEEGAIRHGLEQLLQVLAGEWQREDGAALRIEQLLIDCGYKPDVVFDFCRASPASAILMPSRGRFIGAAHKPMDEFSKRPGEKLGHFWHVPPPARGRSMRAVHFDANYWKSFLHARLGTAVGDRGALTLFGKEAHAHEIYAEHLGLGEMPVRVTANGRTVDQWQPRPGYENHYLDTAVMNAVAASMRGCVLPATASAPKKVEELDLAALQRQRRRGVLT